MTGGKHNFNCKKRYYVFFCTEEAGVHTIMGDLVQCYEGRSPISEVLIVWLRSAAECSNIVGLIIPTVHSGDSNDYYKEY